MSFGFAGPSQATHCDEGVTRPSVQPLQMTWEQGLITMKYELSMKYTLASIDLRNIRMLFDNSFLHDGHIFADSPCFLSLLDDEADEPSKVKATGVKCFMLHKRREVQWESI